MRALAGALRPAAGVLACGLALACSKKKEDAPAGIPTPSAVGSIPAPPSATPVVLPAPVASGLPDPQSVSAVVNPMREAAYSGPVGTVRGRVVAKGDKAPPQPAVIAKVPAAGCAAARDGYGKLFREGADRALADVLIAVTGYKGYVPERANSVRVTAKDCFYGTRTIALTYGQSIEVASGDQQTYIPELLGEHGQPQLVATPHGDTVSPVYPTRAGRYVLIDNLRLFMSAEVIVLKYATHAVTGLDGRFEIPGVPVGQVNVNALLPATGVGAQRQVTVEADKPTEEIVFELAFDADEFAKKQAAAATSAAAPAPSVSVSAGPGASSARPPGAAPSSAGPARSAAPKPSR